MKDRKREEGVIQISPLQSYTSGIAGVSSACEKPETLHPYSLATRKARKPKPLTERFVRSLCERRDLRLVRHNLHDFRPRYEIEKREPSWAWDVDSWRSVWKGGTLTGAMAFLRSPSGSSERAGSVRN